MEPIDCDSGLAVRPAQAIRRVGSRRPRISPEFENDIRQLYMRMMDDPVPPRLLGVLRAALAAPRT